MASVDCSEPFLDAVTRLGDLTVTRAFLVEVCLAQDVGEPWRVWQYAERLREFAESIVQGSLDPREFLEPRARPPNDEDLLHCEALAAWRGFGRL